MIDEATLMCDRLKQLMTDAISLTQNSHSSEKVAQLREFQNAIMAMQQMGMGASGDPYKLKESLSQETSQTTKALGHGCSHSDADSRAFLTD